jgi:hypothetical protein
MNDYVIGLLYVYPGVGLLVGLQTGVALTDRPGVTRDALIAGSVLAGVLCPLVVVVLIAVGIKRLVFGLGHLCRVFPRGVRDLLSLIPRKPKLPKARVL